MMRDKKGKLEDSLILKATTVSNIIGKDKTKGKVITEEKSQWKKVVWRKKKSEEIAGIGKV